MIHCVWRPYSLAIKRKYFFNVAGYTIPMMLSLAWHFCQNRKWSVLVLINISNMFMTCVSICILVKQWDVLMYSFMPPPHNCSHSPEVRLSHLLFSIHGWARCFQWKITHVTYSVIGWNLARPWIDDGPLRFYYLLGYCRSGDWSGFFPLLIPAISWTLEAPVLTWSPASLLTSWPNAWLQRRSPV